MITIFTGSRHITDYEFFKQTEIVEGECWGVDLLAKKYGWENNISVIPFPADWENFSHSDAIIRTNKYGKHYDVMAGMRRNRKMGDFVVSQGGGGLIAVWDGKSKGTRNIIIYAKEIGLKVYLEIYKGKQNV